MGGLKFAVFYFAVDNGVGKRAIIDADQEVDQWRVVMGCERWRRSSNSGVSKSQQLSCRVMDKLFRKHNSNDVLYIPRSIRR